MINILFITAGLHRGGAERQLLNLLSGLDKTRFSPLLVIMNRHGERVQEALQLGIEVRFILRRWRWDLLLFREFVRIIRQDQIRIVHTWGMMPAFYILLARPFSGFIWINSSIRHVLTSFAFRYSILARLLLHASDYRVANSLAGLRSYGFRPSSKNLVIYNGIVRKEIREEPARLREKYGIPDDAMVVTSAGRFEKDKDFSGVLRVAAGVIGVDPRAFFLICGNGSLENRLRSQARELGIEKNVTFTGFLDNLQDVLDISSLFILLSGKTYGEGTASALAEAMASGIPVIGSDSGGNRELIEHGQSGFLFRYGEYEQITGLMEDLLRDKDFSGRIGEHARTRINDTFSFPGMVNRYQELYTSVA